MSCDKNGFIFLGYEPIYGRIGLGVYLQDVTANMKQDRLKEIEVYYRDQFQFSEVRVVEDENDPYMSLVFVKINKPYATNFYKSL